MADTSPPHKTAKTSETSTPASTNWVEQIQPNQLFVDDIAKYDVFTIPQHVIVLSRTLKHRDRKLLQELREFGSRPNWNLTVLDQSIRSTDSKALVQHPATTVKPGVPIPSGNDWLYLYDEADPILTVPYKLCIIRYDIVRALTEKPSAILTEDAINKTTLLSLDGSVVYRTTSTAIQSAKIVIGFRNDGKTEDAMKLELAYSTLLDYGRQWAYYHYIHCSQQELQLLNASVRKLGGGIACRPSTLPSAGLGLFVAEKPVVYNELITDYAGQLISWKKAHTLNDSHMRTLVSMTHVINGRVHPTTGESLPLGDADKLNALKIGGGQFANDGLVAEKAINAFFYSIDSYSNFIVVYQSGGEYDAQQRFVFAGACVPIPIDDEVLVSYGEDYW